jgi:predicted Fe-S protein YdhL (DUF1289 family)
MTAIHITDIESAINHWRSRAPSTDGLSLAAPTRALAEVYAWMAVYHEDWVDAPGMPEAAYQAWLSWYETTPDTPCIAICSTSQGDALCKGCGRTFEEVQRWTEMGPSEKRMVWHRINTEASAWRYNRYAERAKGDAGPTIDTGLGPAQPPN